MERPRILVTEVVYLEGWFEVPKGPICNHACAHPDITVVAWGPTYTQYELVVCVVCGCRTWADLRAADPVEDQEFWIGTLEWYQPG